MVKFRSASISTFATWGEMENFLIGIVAKRTADHRQSSLEFWRVSADVTAYDHQARVERAAIHQASRRANLLVSVTRLNRFLRDRIIPDGMELRPQCDYSSLA